MTILGSIKRSIVFKSREVAVSVNSEIVIPHLGTRYIWGNREKY